MVVGAVGAEEHLAGMLVDLLEPPTIVVELGLVAQVPGPEADVCEFDDVDHVRACSLSVSRCATGPDRAPSPVAGGGRGRFARPRRWTRRGWPRGPCSS